jgi:hypothetical protein
MLWCGSTALIGHARAAQHVGIIIRSASASRVIHAQLVATGVGHIAMAALAGGIFASVAGAR